MSTPPSKPSLNTTESHVAAPPSTLATPSPPLAGTLPQPGPSSAAVATGVACPQVPGYEVLSELGRGGMGVVYLAKNVLMDRREVLKVVNRALLDRPGVMERFLREIRSAAMLNHNNVVKAYSAVQAGESIVFAMEYVEGEDLNKVVQRQGPLPILYACHYVSQAALGLQHAHEHHMVHRDIKPHNLILSRQAKKHIVKVLDFGLAKAKREGAAAADLTGEGAMMGTPAYMAPEQARDAASADVRADVYSLGCTLYFLLTGAPPFSGRSFFEILQAHVSTEATPLHQSRAGAPAELGAVVARMMAKDPTHRFQTPTEAARALAPFIKPQASSAKSPAVGAPPRAGESESKKVSEPVPAVVSPAGRAPQRQGVARVAAAKGKTAPARPRPVAKKRSMKWVMAGLGGALLLLAGGAVWLWSGHALWGKASDGKRGAGQPPEVDRPIAGDYDLTGGHRFVHFGADGPRVVLGLDDGTGTAFARVYDLNTGRAVTPPHDALFPAPCFSSDGRWVVTINQNADVWSAATGGSLSPPAKPDDFMNAPDSPEGLPDYLAFATFSPDGKRTLTTYGNGFGALGALGGQLGGALGFGGGLAGQVGGVPGGQLGALGGAPGGIAGVPPPGGVPGVPNGAKPKGKALVCNAATGKALTPPLMHDGGVVQGMFSPDGRWVVTASEDGTARVWDAADGHPISPPLQHGAALRHAAFSPDGKRIVTASEDKSARMWDAVSGDPVCPSFSHGDVVNHAAFSPDGTKVVTASADKTARVWDAATGDPISPPLQHDDAVSWAVFSPDGKAVVTASIDKTARVWDVAAGTELLRLAHDDAVEHVAFSPDGSQVVTESLDHTARLWDAKTGQQLKKATISPD